MWQNVRVDDLLCPHVAQTFGHAEPGFDPYFPFDRGKDEQHTIVLPWLPNAPAIAQLHSDFLDRLVAETRQRDHDELIARFRLQLLEPAGERALGLRREKLGTVHDPVRLEFHASNLDDRKRRRSRRSEEHTSALQSPRNI